MLQIEKVSRESKTTLQERESLPYGVGRAYMSNGRKENLLDVRPRAMLPDVLVHEVQVYMEVKPLMMYGDMLPPGLVPKSLAPSTVRRRWKICVPVHRRDSLCVCVCVCVCPHTDTDTDTDTHTDADTNTDTDTPNLKTLNPKPDRKYSMLGIQSPCCYALLHQSGFARDQQCPQVLKVSREDACRR